MTILGIFCKHDWQILSEITSKSPMECAEKSGIILTKGPSAIVTRKLVQIVSCKKCGKIKKFVTEV